MMLFTRTVFFENNYANNFDGCSDRFHPPSFQAHKMSSFKVDTWLLNEVKLCKNLV